MLITLDVATGQPRGAPMKHGGRVLGALFDKAEARMLSLGFIQLYVWSLFGWRGESWSGSM